MTFAEFWHLCTTTRYTRSLEREVEELRKQNKALIFAMGRAPELPETTDEPPLQPPQPQRMRKRRGFSQIKRELERVS